MKFSSLLKGFLLSSVVSLPMSMATFADTKVAHEKNTVNLNEAAQKSADIQVMPLELKELTYIVSAPGEVIPNANSTTKITSRVPAQVLKRYVQEGQHVKEGEPLLDLSSVDMAKTQGDLLLADQEWKRVKSLGKDAISAKRYSEAQVAYQHAYSTAMAYGMTEGEVNELLKTQKPSAVKGEFKLLATRSGTVFNITATEGELVDAGKVLLQIVEEKSVWIDAKLPPTLERTIKVGDPVHVKVGEVSLTGSVIQVHHQLDEITRTRPVRLEIPNDKDLLHPGQFVNCQIEAGKTKPSLTLPISAVVRTSDGDWAVFIEKQPGKFQQVEVKLGDVIDNQAIIEGISPNTRVVVKGAFFIHSELNKSSFDGH